MTNPKTAPQPAENFWAQVDAMRSELAADIREVFDANGPETPQIVRDVIEYADSWLQVAIQRESERSARPQPPAGIWVPTELAERVQETLGEFLMDHGWRQIDMDTSDEFGALLAVATKAEPLQQPERVPLTDKEIADVYFVALGSQHLLGRDRGTVTRFARAVEEHHGIKPKEQSND